MVKFSRCVVLYLIISVLFALAVAGSMVSGSSVSSAVSPGRPSALPAPSASLEPSVDFIQAGLSGDIEADITVMELAQGEKAVLLGTSRGLYSVSRGALLNYIATPNSVVDIALLDDVTGDGQQDIVLVVWDTYFPNIRCHDSATGARVWQFIPKQEVFVDNLMWTEQQTLTFDIEALYVNDDNIQDVVATSGYWVYAIDGQTGSKIWNYEAANNLWKIAVTADLDGDGTPDLAVGGQNGFMHVLSGKDGALLWRDRIAEKYDVIGNKGAVWATVDRSVWDIVPVGSRGNSRAIVSSEDGMVRLIDLNDGVIEWEIRVIDYVMALQYEYYQQTWKKPTSPGDLNFFNLKVRLVSDITGDGIEEVLASTYVGQAGQSVLGKSGLFMLNGASGLLIWQKMLDLGNISQVEVVAIDGEQVALLPQGKSGFTDKIGVIDLEDGTSLELIEIESGPESAGDNRYAVRDLGDDTFILASNSGDLLLVSTDGDVLWDYPRIADIAVEQGEFCGDGAEDFLVRSKTYTSGGREATPTARVLYVIDGATGQKAWSYEVPYEEFVATGGISDIQITPDINGDGRQDIVGFLQVPEWERDDEEFGEDSRIILLSGRDGTVLLEQPVTDRTYYGVWEKLYQDPSYREKYIRQWHEQELQRQLDEIEWDMRQHDTPEDEIQQRLSEEEEGRRRNFEENELPKQLDNLRERLANEEQHRKINKWILSLGVARFLQGGPAPVCLMVRTPRDIYLLDPAGETLLTWTFDPGSYHAPYGEETELPPGVKPGAEGLHWTRMLVLDDLNGDGGDDLVMFTNREIYIFATDIDARTGDLDFYDFLTIEVEEGIDGQQGWLADDIDGDGIREFFYFRHQENRSPLLTFVSPVTGERLLEMEYDPNSSTFDPGCADFDGDGYPDTLLCQRWVEGKEGPRLEVRSGRDQSVIWEFNDYRADHLFNLVGYWGSFMPACPVSDISGDGVTDLALIKNLTWQPGAQIVLYDVTHDKEVNNIVLEEIDPTSHHDRRWHPGFLVKEITDVNGDGSSELALIIALGQTDRTKEWQLMVVDIHNGELLADFQVMGSDFIELPRGTGFGMTGLGGELYILDVASDLRITSPAEGSVQTSPVTVEWTGAGEGAFNQIFVDGTEVGRTNENEFTVAVAQGEHELKIRSVDEYGRGIYRTVNFDLEKGSASTGLIIWLILFLIITLAPALWGFIVRYRRRRARHG